MPTQLADKMLADYLFLKRYMERLFKDRNLIIKEYADA